MATKQQMDEEDEKRAHRTRLDIISEILTLCLRAQRKTFVMYKSNLSYDQLSLYLQNLVRCGALEKVDMNDGSTRYVTSDEATKWLEGYAKLKVAFGSFGFGDQSS